MEYNEYELGDLLIYEQPTAYMVESTDYNDDYKIPVLTAGKSFILGYTNEETGIFTNLPVVIFDDFTTASQYVNFPFKVKSSAMKILIPNTELVLPKYIYYRMQIIQFDHSTHKRYWIQQYSKIKVTIPPLPEQERIVSRIEELFSQLDDGVETLRKTKAQLAVYRQAVYSEGYSNLSTSARITNYFDITGGLTKNSSRNEFPIKKPYLRVANVYYNQLDLEEIMEIGVKESEIAEKTLAKNDLLFVEGNGSKEQIGRVAIWDGSIQGCLHQNHIMKGRPNGRMLSKYALFYLISPFGRKQIVDIASSTSGLYTLSAGKIGNLMIPYCEIEDQNAIIEKIETRLSVCDSIEQTVDAALQQAATLRQSILKEAFEGRLLDL